MTKSNRGSRAGSGGQGSSRSPTAESVNKWKIPHYYRRSPSSASQHSNTGDSNGSSTPSTPNINVMNSPKKVLLEDRKKGKKKSGYRSKRSNKKNPGEMVFVNYTVQDGSSDNESVGSQGINSAEIPTPLPKKKSSRSRMLKIFGNSKNEPPQSPDAVTPAKRSYNPLYKYTSALPGRDGGINSDEEVVPTSQPLLSEKQHYDPLSAEVLDPFAANGQENSKFNNDFVVPDSHLMGSRTTDENDASIAFSKMFSRKRANTGGSMSSLNSLNTSLQQQPSQFALQQQHHHQPQQLRHSQSFSNLGNVVVPATQRNPSFSFVSSFNNKFSPIRTASPARPRSARASSGLRLSRDMSSFQDVPESSTPAIVSQEMFLDTQTSLKTKPTTGNKYKRKQDSMPEIHRIYTPSTATSNASGTPSSSLVTPPTFPAGYTAASSASSTPNALELSQINNSTSNSTVNNTNIATNLEPCTSHNMPSTIFYKDTSAELLLEDSDMPTPIENFPALKGIPRTTLEEKEEDEDGEPGISSRLVSTNDRTRPHVSYNEPIDYVQFAHGSSTSSSQVDSIMTNSLSATTTNSLMGGHYFQEHLASGQNCKELKTDLQNKLSARATSALNSFSQTKTEPQNLGSMGSSSANNEAHDPFYKMNLEFDFENPDSFFREPKSGTPTNDVKATVSGNADLNSNATFHERYGNAHKPNHHQTVSTSTRIASHGTSGFEDGGTSVPVTHDLFEHSDNNNVAAKSTSNFPFYNNGGVNDFSYF
ncbi:BCK2 (YER167W) [Zygosaccharomyces parabailii]|nr:BCK2 (YER167W) [Zygosaccharomyces parabailii]